MRKFKKLLRLLPHSVYRKGLRYGVAAAVEHRNLLANGEWQTIIDVGANKGQFSLAARRFLPAVRIEAFEPLPEPRSRYARVFGDDDNVNLHPLALSDSNGSTTMNVSARDDSSSLLPIGKLQIDVFPGTQKVREEVISTRRLDDVGLSIERPCLLKIDVQGFEMQVLRGAETTLQSIDDICIELSFVELFTGQALAGDVSAWLEQRGFQHRQMWSLQKDKSGNPVQADFHFSANRLAA